MITRVTVENFKRFTRAEFDLGHSAVFIGPNNSGKTTALQAMALWDVGLSRWLEKRKDSNAQTRTGVTINRRDLASIPTPSAKLLWHGLKTHYADKENNNKTQKIYMRVTAEGVSHGNPWRCGLEFYYANEESFYCRLIGDLDDTVRNVVARHRLVYMPPMSGLADREYRKEPGEVAVLIGEGQTAQVLRNLCWQLFSRDDNSAWYQLVERVGHLFSMQLIDPQYIPERSELRMSYREIHASATGVELDISSSGRGCQQVVLLLSYILANPGSVMLLDEPDAHLEILRQRDVYNLLTEIASEQDSQIVAASHSEVVLEEAGDRDVVVAFVGDPHRVDTQGRSQLRKALEKIPLADYYKAEHKGWILYLEGSTDLAILRELARRLEHPARRVLDATIPVHYIGSNRPQSARDHFYGLREAKPDLAGLAIFDRLDRDLVEGSALRERQWGQRELENYLVTHESLLGLVRAESDDASLFKQRNEQVFEECIGELVRALEVANHPDPWGPDIKVTDEFLDPLFKNFFKRINTPQLLFKRDYHRLATTLPIDQVHEDIIAMLDCIMTTADHAAPRVS